MKRIVFPLIVLAMVAFVSCKDSNKENGAVVAEFRIPQNDIERTVRSLKEYCDGQDADRIEKGVSQVAALWQEQDGSLDDFYDFCMTNFVLDSAKRFETYKKIERNLEILYGYGNTMTIKLMEPLHLDMGEIDFVDEAMGAYSTTAHVKDDLFANKMAFYIVLNFPSYSLAEKKQLCDNWTRQDWAYARLGDRFTSRVPAEYEQAANVAMTNADNYISSYNIYMGNLVDNNGQTLFPKDMKLISHWNLRDELKSDYSDSEHGLEKQQMIYDVMLHIVNQDIPQDVINSDKYQWNPRTNKLYKDGAEVSSPAEPFTRYEHILYNFKALSAMDKFNSVYPTYIERAFDETMELTQDEVEKLFIDFISAPEIAQVGQLISKRLGRPLQPYDIWYNGFTARNDMNEAELDRITRQRYPNPSAFGRDIPRILTDLGWSREKANSIAAKISVDPARGAGHAWGSEMKGDVAHLRTRIAKSGMDYKGYNIAVHELGHCVEQTITLYDIDYYMLKGIPNTAFTEAVAFMFQGRDLKLLGQAKGDASEEKEAMAALENCWSAYEIMGVSLVDLYMWRWMYENQDANAQELRDAVVSIAKDVWNKYYAPVFGVKDSPILAIYSHMIDSPLYLANYPVGHLIDYQIETYMADKPFADELTRILLQGSITPQAWMKGAVGAEISGEPTLAGVRRALAMMN